MSREFAQEVEKLRARAKAGGAQSTNNVRFAGEFIRDLGTLEGGVDELLQHLTQATEMAGIIADALRNGEDAARTLARDVGSQATATTVLLIDASNALEASSNKHNVSALRYLGSANEETGEGEVATLNAQSEMEAASQIASSIPEALNPIVATLSQLKDTTQRATGALNTTVDKSGAAASDLYEAETHLKAYRDQLGWEE